MTMTMGRARRAHDLFVRRRGKIQRVISSIKTYMFLRSISARICGRFGINLAQFFTLDIIVRSSSSFGLFLIIL